MMNRKWARAGNRNSSFVLSALLLVGVFVFAQDPPPQPATSPNLDQQLQTRLEFQRAAKQADDAERIKIESRACAALALRLLGHIEIDKFNWNGAIEHYSESLAILDSADGRFDLVLAYMKGQKFLEAEKEAQLLVEHQPDDYRGWALISRIALAEGHDEKAVEALSHSLQLHPDLRTAYTLGETLLRLKEKDRADEVFRNILRSAGEHGDLHMLIGTAYLNADFIPDAIREFTSGLSLDPNLGAGHTMLGYSYWVLNQYQYNADSMREFLAAVHQAPNDYYANYYLGQLLSQQKDYENAAVHLQLAAQADPASPDPWLYLGLNSFSTGNYEAAKSFLEKATLITGKHEERNGYQILRAYLTLSRVAANQGDVAAARSMYLRGQALKLRSAGTASLGASTGMVISLPNSGQRVASQPLPTIPSNSPPQQDATNEDIPSVKREWIAARETELRELLASLLNDLGTSEARGGNYEAALGLFQAASKWDPKLPLIYRNIGLAALRLGNFSESLRMLRLAITADAKDDRSRSLFVQTSLEWAKALDEQGKLSQSAKVLEEASSIAPENADVHEALVVVYGKLGKHADAKRHANKLKGLKGQSEPTRSQ